MSEMNNVNDKSIVAPGDYLSDDANRAGEGTYVKDGKVYSSLFGIVNLKNRIRVIPLSGKYVPAAGDTVIGTVKEITFSNWIVDIHSPYEGLLHISEFPRRIESDDMGKHIRVGDSILAQVKDIDATMKVELTLGDQRLGVLKSGRLLEMSSAKVPRLIGRGGSMISMLKNETKCNIFVGQNGIIWINGKEKDMSIAAKAIMIIENEAHLDGLTDRIGKFLRDERGSPAQKQNRQETPAAKTDSTGGGEAVKKGDSILEELLGDREREEER